MTLSDVKRDFVDQIMEQGLANSRSKAESLFVDALTRNMIEHEILEMCRYIVQEETARSEKMNNAS